MTHTHTHTHTPEEFDCGCLFYLAAHLEKYLALLRFIAYNDYERTVRLCDIIYHQIMSKGLACEAGIQCKRMPSERLLWPASSSSVASHVAR